MIARFHRSGATPSVMELLKRFHRGVASSGANSRNRFSGMSSGPRDYSLLSFLNTGAFRFRLQLRREVSKLATLLLVVAGVAC